MKDPWHERLIIGELWKWGRMISLTSSVDISFQVAILKFRQRGKQPVKRSDKRFLFELGCIWGNAHCSDGYDVTDWGREAL